MPIHPLRRLWPVLRPYSMPVGWFLVLGMLASLAEGLGIGMMIPLLQGKSTAAGAGNPVLGWIEGLASAFPAENRDAAIASLMLASILLKTVLAYACTCIASYIQSDVQHRLRTQLFRQTLTVSQSYLDGQEGGTLLRTLIWGPRDAGTAVVTALWLLLNIATLLVFSALLIAIAWQLTLAVVVTMLLLYRLVRLATRHIGPIGHRVLKVENALSQMCKESLLGIRTIRAFGREGYEEGRFAELSLRGHRIQVRQKMLLSLVHPLTEGLAAAVMVGLVFLSLQAHFSLPLLVTMAFMLYRLQPQIQNGNANFALLASLDASLAATLAFLEESDKPYLRSGSEPFERLERGIRFEKVSFSYRGREPALKDVDLDIARGKTTALVGRSGAGKSTLVHLVSRFYDPDAGRILVDGKLLADLDLAQWRGRVALVGQDVHIFSATVRDNILYGRPGADDVEIVAAAKRAHAHEFITELPQGYDTLVGDRGLLLSGGQRQRLSIARAILLDPEILLLDEATNALDALSEAYIQASIEELGRNRTVVVVAHRLSTIERADRIVVLEQGRVAEQGRFEELLGRGGLFAALYRSHRLGIVEAETVSASLTWGVA